MESAAWYVFLLAIAVLIVHELDAIQEREWQFFFHPHYFAEAAARRLFIAAHVPLIVLILANLSSRGFQIGMDVFLIVHLGLHWFLRSHPLIQFKSWFSWVWIVGAAVRDHPSHLSSSPLANKTLWRSLTCEDNVSGQK
ncbi:MAG: DUF6713 family protein [Anaerolineae bacterium]